MSHSRSRWAGPSSLLLCLGLLLVLGGSVRAQEPDRTLSVIRVKGVIDPPVSDYLSSKLRSADRDGVHAIVIQLDTPGGLDVSMREIIQEILDTDAPVAVWIAPRGARAASAGTFISYAADLAYMAEATELGAATPIDLSGGDLDRKVTNDAAAFIRDLAERVDRNPDWAERAVREGAALGSTEAAEMGVVTGIASSLGDLLRAMDGETVDESTLETWSEETNTPSVTIRFEEMNLVQRLLHAVTGPEIAFFLLLIGFFGIIFELYNPGIGLAGILGAVSLLLGFYGLSVLPTNWVGVLLIAAAVIFFIVDLQIAGMGVWTVGGVAALILGGLILFSGTDASVTLSPWAIAGGVAFTLVFFVSVMTAALRVRMRRPVMGEESIVGTIGTAQTDIAPEGMVATKGMLWRARTMESGIAAGEKVEIKATEGLILLVEPYEEQHAEPASP
jgi:membrane-bound serine protease (ClpP class)